MTSESQEVLDYLKGFTAALTKTQLQEITNKFGSVREFAKVSGIKISSKANTNLDVVYNEIAAQYPGYFDSDITEGDIPSALADTVEMLCNNTLERDDLYLASEIFKEIRNTLDNTGKRAENRRIAEAKQEERNKGIELVNEVKQRQEQARANNRVKELRYRTEKLLKTFEKRLTKPTENSHIPSN